MAHLGPMVAGSILTPWFHLFFSFSCSRPFWVGRASKGLGFWGLRFLGRQDKLGC